MGIGIETLNEENRVPARGNIDAGTDSMKSGLVYGGGEWEKYIILKIFSRGILPKFARLEINDELCRILREKFSDVIQPEDWEPQTLSRYLKTYPMEAAWVMDEIGERDEEFYTLPRFVVKGHLQDHYHTKLAKFFSKIPFLGNIFGGVIADLSGMLATSTVSKQRFSFLKTMMSVSWRAFGKDKKKNRNKYILQEVLSCNLAQSVGMKTQDQTLVFSEYEDGKIKLLAQATWDFGLQEMGKNSDGEKREYVGDGKKGGCYLATLENREKGHYLSDDETIMDLGEQLIGLMLGDDTDSPGNRVQNKAWRPGSNTYFGIDFGHALRGKNHIVTKLDDAFSFDTGGRNYKNLSVFFDNPLSEKMKGVYLLRKAMTGISPSEKILAGYSREFREKIENIKPFEHNRIFQAYIDRFVDLSKIEKIKMIEAKEELEQAKLDGVGFFERRKLKRKVKRFEKSGKQYLALAVESGRAKHNYVTAAEHILSVFADRIDRSPIELTLMDNLEKLASKSSLVSVEKIKKGKKSGVKTIFLNHLKIEKKDRKKCNFYTKDGLYALEIECDEGVLRKFIEQNLLELGKNADFGPIVIYKHGIATIKFPPDKLDEIAGIFDEHNIQKFKHPKDFQQREAYKRPGQQEAKARLIKAEQKARKDLDANKDLRTSGNLTGDKKTKLVSVFGLEKPNMGRLKLTWTDGEGTVYSKQLPSISNDSEVCHEDVFRDFIRSTIPNLKIGTSISIGLTGGTGEARRLFLKLMKEVRKEINAEKKTCFSIHTSR